MKACGSRSNLKQVRCCKNNEKKNDQNLVAFETCNTT